MANKMLIDATHREETRVVVCKGSRVEEFDLESQERRQLKGNIYLAKVTRVEPSLQAAFVDYGGNRHGFLAFSEIHPDYYQIPFSDRQELLKEAAEAEADQAEADETASDDGGGSGEAESAAEAEDAAESESAPEVEDALEAEDAGSAEDAAEAGEMPAPSAEAGAQAETQAESDQDSSEAGEDAGAAQAEDDPARSGSGRRPRRRRRSAAARATAPVLREDADEEGGNGAGEEIESVGAEDALEELPDRHVSKRRQYKIQEVIRRRQILLVQVVKEERGTKGAALTTYLSLAGRYCVLMPNTARGGGISRKITSATDRRRLKSIAGDLKVAEGTGVIVRTAGANRTKAEIKRDFEYLQRLWESIRTLTLKSTAPSLIYEEGSLIKRSIRDLYNKEIEEVLVEGEGGYREAKAFMRMLMPSHARHVKQYKDDQPLFVRHRVESQLNDMFVPEVTLKSGGYLVINQTEALVAIDVNSGKATREHNVEDTALQTNLEAAAEVARQLRLRDLAGLIVIDFIDMEERRNNRAVERKIKEALKTDRARIQVGRISHFGLLEMSRQRIRASVIEGTMEVCRHCEGSGRTRSVSSTALQILRSLEEMVAGGKRHHLTISSGTDIALYMLNQKRTHIGEIEARYGIEITISVDETLAGSAFTIERGEVADQPLARPTDGAVQIDTVFEEAEPESEPAEGEEGEPAEADSTGSGRRRRRRRGRRRPEEVGEAGETAEAGAPGDADDSQQAEAEGEAGGEGDEEAGRARPKRRRGRRGGRRQRRDESGLAGEAAGEDAAAEDGGEHARAEAGPQSSEEAGNGGAQEAVGAGEPAREIDWPWQGASQAAKAETGAGEPEADERSNGASAEAAPDSDIAAADTGDAVGGDADIGDAEGGDGEPAAAQAPGEQPEPEPEAGSEAPAPSSQPQRRGWWQRRFAS